MIWIAAFGVLCTAIACLGAVVARRWWLVALWSSMTAWNVFVVYLEWPRPDPPTIECYEGMTLLPHQSCTMHVTLPGTPA